VPRQKQVPACGSRPPHSKRKAPRSQGEHGAPEKAKPRRKGTQAESLCHVKSGSLTSVRQKRATGFPSRLSAAGMTTKGKGVRSQLKMSFTLSKKLELRSTGLFSTLTTRCNCSKRAFCSLVNLDGMATRTLT